MLIYIKPLNAHNCDYPHFTDSILSTPTKMR